MEASSFKDFGKIIIRRPLYSYLTLFNQDNETKNLEELVHCRLNDPVFMEGLYWSSPQLYNAVLKYKEDNFKSSKANKLMSTLKKYLIRASTRCTPYGIYAGSAIANIGNHELLSGAGMERKVRIDVGLLQQIKNTLEVDPLVWPHLRYSVNNSLFVIPGQYRFIESVIENGKTRYQISSIDQAEHLEKIITLAKKRTISLMDIYSLLKNEFGYKEVEGFVQELIKNQFLISELQLGATVENDFERIKEIVERLKEEDVKGLNKYIALFSAIDNILKKFIKLPIGKLPVKEITDLEILLDECGVEDREEHIFQADLK